MRVWSLELPNEVCQVEIDLHMQAQMQAQRQAQMQDQVRAQVKAQAQLRVQVSGVGLLGPGLIDWPSAQPLLRDPARWISAATVVPAPQRLPATERRRAGTVVKASIVVADEALQGSGIDPAELATVFTSSTGDPLNCHLLCEALAQPQRTMSPTRFTNSVHNAPAGYWHISTQSRAASTSLAAFDASFAAGLLEAATQCAVQRQAVLLVACDVPYPEPLHSLRPVTDVFAVALLLQPLAQDSSALPVGMPLGFVAMPGCGQVASTVVSPVVSPVGSSAAGRILALTIAAEAPAQDAAPAALAALGALYQGIPAARALPLLQALAGDAACSLRLPALPDMGLQLSLSARPQHAAP